MLVNFSYSLEKKGHFLKRKNYNFLNINVKQKGEIYFYEKFTSRNKDRRNFIMP